MAAAGKGKQAPLLDAPPERSDALTLEEAEANWDRLSYRERMGAYFRESAGANYTLPVFLIVLVTIVLGLIWFAAFWYLVRDASLDFFSERNMRKFILYNVLHGVLGLGASSGPLGVKFRVPFGNAALVFLTPGTLCSPLFPRIVGLLQHTPGRRSLVQVLLYVAYVSALVYAIADPSSKRVTVANVALLAATVGDFTIFLASRGEHYGYMMVSMSFPDWIAGCQWVQLVLWIMVGVSKCGPWFKYAIQVLVRDAVWTPCLPRHFSAKLFNRDFQRGDYTPSRVAHCLAALGAAGEWGFPLCCVLGPPGSPANAVGVFGMIVYHAFIWCTLPTASVFEWQYYTIVMTYFLYRLHPIALPTSPLLLAFLAVVLVVLPIVGQLKPTLVPFLLAYRQYSGNWRMGSFLLRKSARPKFGRLRTYENIRYWEDAPAAMGGERANYKIAAPFMVVPQFRGSISAVEALHERLGTHPDDFDGVESFMFINAVMGWNLGGGWEVCRESWREAMVEICGLEPGDMYMVMAEPVEPLPPYYLAFRIMDMAKGPLDAEVFARVPYAELEGTHPLSVHIKPERIQSGRSIKGTFLGTYYL
mmetsp:Transcript_129800/g.403711  ORF Transcript_129800/g.403711 Transcript_129800/m.403711 type:complete len:588 (+) Transcript_129800:70-1833(+)|eukprot:CAMPEP_0204591440 /NCGR_PEP_ID=MMETSP0661-20131031/50362_1 /ASSEMBLY_ACC=CAM_ASM_000606 /TAXON_ID=109239 /ORGANISM="Alexandrium margalefi, Strain AMGDE01CS-322" /LENGTH=587 /DNA_ID=CAMNT_0051601565 /DNA_START=58 /DNA_END=1821 /DNA_ORIENTATION=+